MPRHIERPVEHSRKATERAINDREEADVIAEVRQMAAERPTLPISSTALIVVAQR